MVRQCFILFGCMAAGELITMLTGVKLPSSIIGMLLLTLLLKVKVIKLEWVRGLIDFLIANLGFFFVPPGVALMLHFDLIRAELMPIVGATLVSTAPGDMHPKIESLLGCISQRTVFLKACALF